MKKYADLKNLGWRMMDMQPDFWKDKKVLITGHNGFKGSWLCLWLKRLGAEVYGFSLPDPPTQPSLYEKAHIDELMDRSWPGTITNYYHINECVKALKPEIVFHLAAQTIVKEGFLNPLDTFQTNIIGTANVLQACEKVPSLQSIVVVTTDKVYEDQEWPWGYRESDPLGANDPYSTSKACAELVAACYRQDKMGNLPLATARAGNVIAGGDFAYRVIPMIVEALAQGKEPPIWDPTAIRPWQHVLDCLNGYMILAERLYEGPNPYLGSWNFGPSEDDYLTVGDLTDNICNSWGDGLIGRKKVECPVTYNLGVDLRLNSSKARRILQWSPKWTVGYTASLVAHWYENFYKGKEARELVYGDIEDWEDW
jgi:CDP-glucose 4,6-dehydratase